MSQESGRPLPLQSTEYPLAKSHESGLPLALQIAREHQGSLSFRSRPGHTVFSFLLPVAETEDSV